MSVRDADKSKPYLPLSGATSDGYNNGQEATATCFCGDVQYAFPLDKVTDIFICHCTDCHKLHSSMFGCNFILPSLHLNLLRGQDVLKTYATKVSIGTKNTMTNHFCGTCGTLMWRSGTGFPGMAIPRVGTVDDFNLMEGRLRPRVEQFIKDRVGWLGEAEGCRVRDEGFYYGKL